MTITLLFVEFRFICALNWVKSYPDFRPRFFVVTLFLLRMTREDDPETFKCLYSNNTNVILSPAEPGEESRSIAGKIIVSTPSVSSPEVLHME